MTDRNYGGDGEETVGDGLPDIALKGDGGIYRLDEIFEALSHQHRRFILYYLRNHEVVSVDELARGIAAMEAECPPDAVSAHENERMVTRLVHTHLPKLEDARFIEYDRRSRTVRYTEPPTLLTKILSVLAEVERDPPE